MDKAILTMMDNLYKNTGKTLEQWITIVKAQNFAKHGEIMKFLKETHSITHGFANFVALKARGADAGSTENKDDLITKQYKGKEHFIPIYEKLISEIQGFGNDIEISPKNANVSLRRKKQFALLSPATKTRFEIGLNMKGVEAKGKLIAEKSGGMCSHKINITDINDLDKEVFGWIKTAYDGAG